MGEPNDKFLTLTLNYKRTECTSKERREKAKMIYKYFILTNR